MRPKIQTVAHRAKPLSLTTPPLMLCTRGDAARPKPGSSGGAGNQPEASPLRHSRVGGNPGGGGSANALWIPAYAGMTKLFVAAATHWFQKCNNASMSTVMPHIGGVAIAALDQRR